MSNLKSILLILLFVFNSVDSQLLAQNMDGVHKKLTFDKSKIQIEYNFKPITDFRNHFKSYSSFFHQCGMPSLPIIRDYIIIPKHSFVSLKASSKKENRISNISIVQSKPVSIDSDNYTDSICNSNYSNIDRNLPSLDGAQVRLFEFDNFDIILFEVYPFKYNPLRKVLIASQNVVIQVNTKINNTFRKPLLVSPIDQAICLSALNYSQVASSIKTITDTALNYIVITHPLLRPAADSLALWKSQQGYHSLVISDSLWTATSIRTNILNLYANASTRPSYVCFLGDTVFVPATEKIAPPPIPEPFSTDLYYTTMDSDSDITSNFGYGRISASSASQAMAIVLKLVHFQKHPPTSNAYYSTAVNCSFFQDDDLNGYDDRRFVQTSEEIITYLQQNYGKNVLRIYEALSTVNPLHWNNDDYANGASLPADLLKPTFPWTGSTSDVINKINQGTFLLLHRDHGYSNASGWAHPQLASSQLQYLYNDSLLPLVFSINCYSGNFRESESFANRFLRQNAGASGIFAPSYYSYSGNNDALALGLYDALFPSPGLIPQFNGTGGNHSPIIPPHISFNKPGDILRYGVWYMNYAWGQNQYSSEIAHFFGDPAMPINTEVPLQILASHKDSIDCVDSVFYVIAPNSVGLTATLTVNNQVIGTSHFVNDTARINFIPQYSDSALIVISGDGRIPYFSSVLWYCSQAIYPPLSGFLLSDSLICNGDIHFEDTSMNFPSSWKWYFGDGSISLLQNPTHHYNQSGIYDISLVVSNQHGQDSVFLAHAVHATIPAIPLLSDTSLCRPSQLLLSPTCADSLVWFMSNVSAPYQWGNHFSTFPTSDTTYYFSSYQDMALLMAGKVDNSGGGGFIFQNKKHYLTFNALSNFLLKSVDVYSNNVGSKTIELLDSTNSVIASKIASVVIGINTIPLDFYISRGNKYHLSAPTYSSLWANFPTVNFPYIIPNVLSIDSSSSVGLTDFYYYFYNWKIQQRCLSERYATQITVVDIDTLLNASDTFALCQNQTIQLYADSSANSVWNTGQTDPSITINQQGIYFADLFKENCSYHTDSLFVITPQNVVADFFTNSQTSPCCFQNLSQNATQYLWNFGDGNFSTEVNPCHQYNSVNEYVVTLTSMNSCDTNMVSKQVQITSINEQNIDETSILLLPNPSKSSVQLIVNSSQKPIQIQLFDATFKLINKSEWTNFENEIDISKLSSGLYFVHVIFPKTAHVLKLVKIN